MFDTLCALLSGVVTLLSAHWKLKKVSVYLLAFIVFKKTDIKCIHNVNYIWLGFQKPSEEAVN